MQRRSDRKQNWTRAEHTVAFYLAIVAFNDLAEMWPFGEVFQVETNVIGLGQVIKVAGVEFEQI